MFGRILAALQLRLEDSVRRAIYACVGAILLLVGAGFLLAAGWSAIADSYGAVAASVVLGIVPIFVGAYFLALARRSKRKIIYRAPVMEPETRGADAKAGSSGKGPRAAATTVAEAFITGLFVGLRGK